MFGLSAWETGSRLEDGEGGKRAAWSPASVPGPLRALFLRIKDRKGINVAAVATARKIAGLIWQLLTKDAPYRRPRPAFVVMKMRKLELRAGAPRAHGPAGPGSD